MDFAGRVSPEHLDLDAVCALLLLDVEQAACRNNETAGLKKEYISISASMMMMYNSTHTVTYSQLR